MGASQDFSLCCRSTCPSMIGAAVLSLSPTGWIAYTEIAERRSRDEGCGEGEPMSATDNPLVT
jgi:hypothetical protein